jgi:hypothetical protein
LYFRMKIPFRKLLPVLGVLVWASGCASVGPPEAPSLELPKPPTDLHASRKGDKVTLTWTIPARTTERQSVRYLGKTRVCRSYTGALKDCTASVGEAAPPPDFEKLRRTTAKKPAASFIDTLPETAQQDQPIGFATYAIEVLNEAGRGAGISNQVRVPLVPTLPPFSSFAARITAQGVLISWQCPPVAERKTGIQYLFRIYRRQEGSASEAANETRIADVEATECTKGPTGLGPLTAQPTNAPANESNQSEKASDSFLDQTFEWERTYFYRGTIVSAIEAAGKPAIQVEGDDTPVAKVFAHDVFPPAVPADLQAVFSGPGQAAFIDLIWSPVTDADLAGYNIYRHEAGTAAVKLNSELVKTPAFRDTNVVSGKTYFYSASAVDERGNESAGSGEAMESVP